MSIDWEQVVRNFNLFFEKAREGLGLKTSLEFYLVIGLVLSGILAIPSFSSAYNQPKARKN